MAEKLLSADNLWRCPRCKDFRAASKQFQLWKLPSHLMIHLKRFGGTACTGKARGSFSKRSDRVETPLEPMDLARFVGGSHNPELNFELYAVCNHVGSISAGHYTACARHCRDGNWYEFNDARCSPISDPSEVISADNYLLFFRQIRQGRPPRQSLSDPQNWPFRLSNIPDKYRANLISQVEESTEEQMGSEQVDPRRRSPAATRLPARRPSLVRRRSRSADRPARPARA